jgi:hypothetical protein
VSPPRIPVSKGTLLPNSVAGGDFNLNVLVGLQQYPANGAIESLCGVAALFTAVKRGDHGNPHTPCVIENLPRAGSRPARGFFF